MCFPPFSQRGTYFIALFAMVAGLCYFVFSRRKKKRFVKRRIDIRRKDERTFHLFAWRVSSFCPFPWRYFVVFCCCFLSFRIMFFFCFFLSFTPGVFSRGVFSSSFVWRLLDAKCGRNGTKLPP